MGGNQSKSDGEGEPVPSAKYNGQFVGMSTAFPKEDQLSKSQKESKPRTPVPKKRTLEAAKPATKRSFTKGDFKEPSDAVPEFGADAAASKKTQDELRDRKDYLQKIGIAKQGETTQSRPTIKNQNSKEVSPTLAKKDLPKVTSVGGKPKSRFSKMIAPKLKPDGKDGFETKEMEIIEVSEEQMKMIRDQSNTDDFALEFPVDSSQAVSPGQVSPGQVSPTKLTESTSPPREVEEKKEVQKVVQTTHANDKLRSKLMSRLTYEKIWLTPAQKPKFYETAIIFDWDDTLLCTSFISPSGIYHDIELSGTVYQHIKLLEITAKKMLEVSVEHGKTYIITNAAEGWVEFSCKKFMPACLPILQKVTIISARARYESKFPTDVPQWKLNTFLETQSDLTDGNIKNLIAIGDSMFELDAAHSLAQCFQKSLIKTIKFKEMPKPNELVRQLNLVISKFEEIVNGSRNVTIKLEKKAG